MCGAVCVCLCRSVSVRVHSRRRSQKFPSALTLGMSFELRPCRVSILRVKFVARWSLFQDCHCATTGCGCKTTDEVDRIDKVDILPPPQTLRPSDPHRTSAFHFVPLPLCAFVPGLSLVPSALCLVPSTCAYLGRFADCMNTT